MTQSTPITMKTALKLSKKELLSLYDKSSNLVKQTLRTEFGEDFFSGEKPKAMPIVPIPGDIKIVPKNKVKWFVNLEAVSDFTQIFRVLGYAYLLWLIF